jgi:hypothetical protein
MSPNLGLALQAMQMKCKFRLRPKIDRSVSWKWFSIRREISALEMPLRMLVVVGVANVCPAHGLPTLPRV